MAEASSSGNGGVGLYHFVSALSGTFSGLVALALNKNGISLKMHCGL